MNYRKLSAFFTVLLIIYNSENVIGQNLSDNQKDNSEIKYKLVNNRAITSGGNYSTPVWSPDGKKILFTTSNNTGLYVIDLGKNGEIIQLNNLPGAGYGAAWSADSKKIFYQHQKMNDKAIVTDVDARSVDIKTKQTAIHNNMKASALASISIASKNSDPIVYTNIQTLLIEAKTLDNSRTWVVTNDSGQYYHAILSPDKTKVIVHKGAEMFVYAVDGSGLINSLGIGIASSWSPDSKQILFFMDESSDGHQITGSELYLCNVDGRSKWKFTNTSSIIEMWPSWSPDGKKICYSDYKSGQIYIADIIIK